MTSLQTRTAETPGAQRSLQTNHDGCMAKHACAWLAMESTSANAAPQRWPALFAVDPGIIPWLSVAIATSAVRSAL